MSTNLTEAQLAALDVRCDCHGYKGDGHGPLCPITRANLSTERAEAAAIGAAAMVHDAHEVTSAVKFGSGSPRKRIVHRASPVEATVSMAELAHGQVIKARKALDSARAYARALENEFDRGPSAYLGSEVAEARAEVTSAEVVLVAAIARADKIAVAEMAS